MAEALGGLAGSVQSFATGMFSKVMALIDTYFPPERRAQVMGWFQKFMSEKPMLAVSVLYRDDALAGHIADSASLSFSRISPSLASHSACSS